ncbi:unnamed protein product [Schistocephalus solidus]|uniref:Galactose-1-phosphate uridylyltransferase n=1 Tax=Schistocephalus solidus TaxID=70667 RepID=A0A183SQK2_SCHSO|nr:unnamed protein product [Schistocephalus solidus]
MIGRKKILLDLEEIEAAAEKVLADQERCKLYDINLRKTQEALNRLKDPGTPGEVWTCLARQFFSVPRSSLQSALQSDISTYKTEDPTASGTFVLPPPDRSHRRYNPLTQEWVIVSPTRLQRPWSGAIEKVSGDQSSKSANSGDTCKENPLAPGATRPGGIVNPNYTSTYTFKNDFPALSPRLGESVDDETVKADITRGAHPLFAWAPATGECQVMCFHPRPDLTLALMTEEDIVKVILEWQRITRDCVERGFQWVQIFENRGEIMGCSNPHPHCQVRHFFHYRLICSLPSFLRPFNDFLGLHGHS